MTSLLTIVWSRLHSLLLAAKLACLYSLAKFVCIDGIRWHILVVNCLKMAFR